MVGLAALTVAITYFLPRITKVVPSTLAAIVVVTTIVHVFHLPTSSVRDLADVHGAWPTLHVPAVPFTMDTLRIIFPYAVLLAGVGLSETLLTQILVDGITGTSSSNDRECVGQGLANVATGFFAGMGGCAMIAQTMLNLQSGGRTRLSGVVEALCIVAFIVVASPLIGMIPMAALVGVMLVVVAKTFAWSSFRILGKIPRSDAFALVLVSTVTVFANLAVAVAVGVVFCCLNFAWTNVTRMNARRYLDDDGGTVYEIHGPLFFGSARTFQALFDPSRDTLNTTVDMRYTYLHDHSALQAVESLADRYLQAGKTLRLAHLSPACRSILARTNSVLSGGEFGDADRHVPTDRLATDSMKAPIPERQKVC
jgi:SulP family sulfate permease